MQPISCAILVLCTATSGANLNLSGTVLDSSGAPKPGVTVKLSKAGVATTTDASGAWHLSVEGVEIREGRIAKRSVARHLALDGRHLRLSFQGFDLAGRSIVSSVPGNDAPLVRTAARTLDASDTLIFSLNGRIFLRDTVSGSRTGMVRRFDTTVNASLLYGWVTDARDGRSYRIVRIGSQTWMAQNLDYSRNGALGRCYASFNPYCEQYGRLYSWAEAVDVDPSYNERRLELSLPARGICPEGWHIPSSVEWKALFDSVYCDTVSSRYDSTTRDTIRQIKTIRIHRLSQGFKSLRWLDLDSASKVVAKGTDLYGFNALPAGYQFWFADDSVGIGEYWHGQGSSTYFWDSDNQADIAEVENDSDLTPEEKDMFINQLAAFESVGTEGGASFAIPKPSHLSVRCLKNDD